MQRGFWDIGHLKYLSLMGGGAVELRLWIPFSLVVGRYVFKKWLFFGVKLHCSFFLIAGQHSCVYIYFLLFNSHQLVLCPFLFCSFYLRLYI